MSPEYEELQRKVEELWAEMDAAPRPHGEEWERRYLELVEPATAAREAKWRRRRPSPPSSVR